MPINPCTGAPGATPHWTCIAANPPGHASPPGTHGTGGKRSLPAGRPVRPVYQSDQIRTREGYRGNGSALTLITDQSETATSLSPHESASALGSILTNMASSFNAGEELLMSTPANSSGNLVGDHMYMVTAVNAATDTVTIQNPWNAAYSGSLSMKFTETIQQLAADNCALWVTSGRPVA